MGQLGFYFDMTCCTGCRCCQIACKDKNDLPRGDAVPRGVRFRGRGVSPGLGRLALDGLQPLHGTPVRAKLPRGGLLQGPRDGAGAAGHVDVHTAASGARFYLPLRCPRLQPHRRHGAQVQRLHRLAPKRPAACLRGRLLDPGPCSSGTSTSCAAALASGRFRATPRAFPTPS